jgi:hypothetical protein
MKTAILAAMLGSAAAFVPAQQVRFSVYMMKVDLYRCIYLIVVWLVASLGLVMKRKP